MGFEKQHARKYAAVDRLHFDTTKWVLTYFGGSKYIRCRRHSTRAAKCIERGIEQERGLQHKFPMFEGLERFVGGSKVGHLAIASFFPFSSPRSLYFSKQESSNRNPVSDAKLLPLKSTFANPTKKSSRFSSYFSWLFDSPKQSFVRLSSKCFRSTQKKKRQIP